MFCGRCGKEITDDSNFCEFCGSRVTWTVGDKVVKFEQSPEDFSFSNDSSNTPCTICTDCNNCRNCCGCHGVNNCYNCYSRNPITSILDGLLTGVAVVVSMPLVPIFLTGKLIGYAADKALGSGKNK